MLFLFVLLSAFVPNLFGADEKSITPHLIRSAIVAACNTLPADHTIKIAKGIITLPLHGLVFNESGRIACGPNSDGTKLYLFNYLDNTIIAEKSIPCKPYVMGIATTEDRHIGIIVSGCDKLSDKPTILIVGYNTLGEHLFFYDHAPKPDPALFFCKSHVHYAHPHEFAADGSVKKYIEILKIENNSFAIDLYGNVLTWHPISPTNSQ